MLEDLQIEDAYDGIIYLLESAKNPPVLHPHRHHELECNLVARGEITYILGSGRFTLKAGTLLWLFPHQTHQMVDRSPDAQSFIVVFKPDLIARACRSERYAALRDPESLIAADTMLSTRLESGDFNHLRDSMHSLLPQRVDSQTLNREVGFGLSEGFAYEHEDPDWLNAGLRQLLLSCWRKQITTEATVGEVRLHPAVRRALDLLQQSGGAISAGDLAKGSGVSSTHLSRIFHSEVGVHIRRYRNTVRLDRFWESFGGARQRTLLESAFAAGFGSYTQFYRVFKEEYGRGPREAMRRSEEEVS